MRLLLLLIACSPTSLPGDVVGRADLSEPAPADLATPPDLVESSALFGPVATIDLPQDVWVNSVAVGDLTGDGLNDVAVAVWRSFSMQDDEVLVLTQTAQHTIGAAIGYDAGSYTGTHLALGIGDLNSDGRADVAVSRYFDVGVLSQNASGTLDPLVDLTGYSFGHGVDDFGFGDFDGDGQTDLVARGAMSPDVAVWFQSTRGMLSPAVSFACPSNGAGGLAVGDLDGDGAADVAIDDIASQSGCYLLQRPGGFAPYVSITLTNLVTGLAIGDVDGDGRDELLFSQGANRPMAFIGILQQTGQHTLAAPKMVPSYDIPASPVIADINGDGRADVIVNHAAWERIGVFVQKADGTLDEEQLYTVPLVNEGVHRIAVGDINGDGRPDIVTGDYQQLFVLLHL